MSKKVGVWVSEKMNNLENRVEGTKDLGERMGILNDYNLVLTGAAEALAAAEHESHAHVNEALDVVNSMMDTIEKRIELSKKLNA